jgi:transmembrane sensor
MLREARDLIMSEKETWDLMVRCLAGEATAAEQQMLAGWLATSHSHRELYEELLSIWQDAAPGTMPTVQRPDALVAYEALSERIHRATPAIGIIEIETREAHAISPNPSRRIFTPLQIAASFLLLATCGALGYYLLSGPWNTAGQNWVTAVNAGGKPRRVTLPDSTHVWLHGHSSLSYPEAFDANRREVKLTGEAFFEVTENKEAPFSVTAGALRTTVLGTSFDINAFEQDQHISVTVLTGRVQVARATAERYEVLGVLKPNEKIMYSRQANDYKLLQLANVYNETSWKDGTLRFRDMNFGQIARKLEQWYGVTIEFENKAVMQCELEGTFSNVSLEKVLKMLSMTANFTYRVEGQTVTITGASCLD